MNKTTSPRKVFAETLLKIAESDDKIIAIVSDTTSRVAGFNEAFPDRFFNVGIAEQNLIGVTAGFAISGKRPFISAMSTFLSMRCFEQVRTSIAYPNLDVKLVGSEGGVTYGDLAPSHHSLEDIAIYRTLPNMTILVPADAIETKKATEAAAKHIGPVYIRITTLNEEPVVYENEKYNFQIGKAITLREGSDVSIIATGRMVVNALAASEELLRKGIKARVINMHTIKPLDNEIVIKAAKETGNIFTVEEHNTIGGLGGAVSEILGEEYPVPVKKLGFQDVFAIPGSSDELFDYYGLTGVKIAATVEGYLRREK